MEFGGINTILTQGILFPHVSTDPVFLDQILDRRSSQKAKGSAAVRATWSRLRRSLGGAYKCRMTVVVAGWSLVIVFIGAYYYTCICIYMYVRVHIFLYTRTLNFYCCITGSQMHNFVYCICLSIWNSPITLRVSSLCLS